MPGGPDARGVYQYAEDDELYPWSTYMNRGQQSVSAAIGDDRARLDDLEADIFETFATITYQTGWRAPTGDAADRLTPFTIRRRGLRCWIDGGSVENSATVSLGVNGQVTAFTIPSSFAPVLTINAPAAVSVAFQFLAFGRIIIKPTGQVILQTTTAWNNVAAGAGSFSSGSVSWVVPG